MPKNGRKGTGMLKRIADMLKGRPDAVTEPTLTPCATAGVGEDLNLLLGQIQPAVDAGFADRDDLIELANDILGDEGFLFTREQIDGIVDERLADHAARQEGWVGMTDNDRLAIAFDRLESEGLIVRENFTCCGTCGSYEIRGEIQKAAAAGYEVKGHAFYHSQDAEGAAEGQRLHLSYGSVDDGDAAGVAIGERIAAVLREEGLDVQWDGTIARRIGIDMEWRRRRPSKGDVEGDDPHVR